MLPPSRVRGAMRWRSYRRYTDGPGHFHRAGWPAGPWGTVSKIERDAAIQRFEYTCEAVWKAGQAFLRHHEGLDIGSPKGVIRAFLQIHGIEEADAQLAMAMIDDRNLAVHTYNESLADAMCQRLEQYAQLMEKWIGSMRV